MYLSATPVINTKASHFEEAFTTSIFPTTISDYLPYYSQLLSLLTLLKAIYPNPSTTSNIIQLYTKDSRYGLYYA
jgi:hypothetical protein